MNLGIGELERLALGEGAQSLGIVERRDPEMGAQGILDHLGISLVQARSPDLCGTSDLGIEIHGDLALGGCHEPMIAHSAMTSKGIACAVAQLAAARALANHLASLALVRSILAAWERGDYSSTEWAHPEIEFVVHDGPDPGIWKGLAEMTESWRSQVSAWEAFDAAADEVRQLDDERVLVLSHFSGRAKTSGLEVGQKGAELFHIRDGKVTRLVTYWERERALADLGLAPERDTPS
jgi:ketosteroid isomerase-like protein